MDTRMITNRELTMDDYKAMLKRRKKEILIPVVLLLLLGFLAYFIVLRKFAKYTSQAVVLVEAQKVPESMVKPVVQDDLSERINVLKAQAISNQEMRPRLTGMGKSEQEADSILEDMRNQPNLIATFTDLSAITNTSVKKKPGQTESSGIVVSYTASKPRDAQLICDAIASKIIDKNLKFIQDNATGTVRVVQQGLEDARNKLNDVGAKLADFKKQHAGELPGDQDSNAKMLGQYLQAEDRATLQLNEFQQDKSFNQAALAQQLGAWKSSQSSTNPVTLQKQLSDLQAQLIDLQARYTDDHPDVMKTKADITEVKKQLAEINKASSDAPDASNDKASAMEPLEIRQLRAQIHKDDEEIATASSEQKRLQPLIAQLQKQRNLSPDNEEKYSELKNEYDNATKTYEGLLANESTASLTSNMSNQGQGESMKLLQPANLPDTPIFPVWWQFLLGGFGLGLAIGFGIAIWKELGDNSIRTEADAEAVLQLPMLVAVPWVGAAAAETKNGSRLWPWKNKELEAKNETIGV
jgi:protein tyrosine kinase modulator